MPGIFLEPFASERQLAGFDASGVKVSGLLKRPRLLGQEVIGVRGQRRNAERLAGECHPGAGRRALPRVVYDVLRLLDDLRPVIVARKLSIVRRSGSTPAAAGFREAPGLALPRSPFETGIVVRLSEECARSRRRQPHRPRRLGEPSFHTSPKLGCERIATPGSPALSAGRSCPALRPAVDGPAPLRRFPARAVCAPIDRPTAASSRLTPR